MERKEVIINSEMKFPYYFLLFNCGAGPKVSQTIDWIKENIKGQWAITEYTRLSIYSCPVHESPFEDMHYKNPGILTPKVRILFFEEEEDAVLFKLTLGGETKIG